MKYQAFAALLVFAVLAACGPDEKKQNNGNNDNNDNTATNNDNTATNNDNTATNNDNTATNNDNAATNNDNAATNNETTGTNNQTTTNGSTTTNNTTTSTNNQTIFECFSNEDCPDDERCEDVAGNDDPQCVVGERGTKTTGEECASETECESGVCISRNDDPEICSEDCGDDMMCPDDLECVSIPFTGGSGMWCVTPQ